LKIGEVEGGGREGERGKRPRRGRAVENRETLERVHPRTKKKGRK
jgi:hypothetical protein